MWRVPKLTGLFIATRGFTNMSQTWKSNGSRDNQQGDYETLSACGILEDTDPMEAQNNSEVVTGRPHLVLLCGPDDSDGE
jgi:hypothetical protein